MSPLARITGWLLVAAAAAAAIAGGHLIWEGAYPEPGGGSLGHVGMIVAGLTLWLGTLLFGGLAMLLLRRRAPVKDQQPADQ